MLQGRLLLNYDQRKRLQCRTRSNKVCSVNKLCKQTIANFIKCRIRSIKQISQLPNHWGQVRSQGGKGGNFSPRNRKKCRRKMVLFPKALFLVTNFRKKIKNKNKKIKNSNFLRIFIKIFQNFLKISRQFVFFVQTRKKRTHSLLTYLKNMRK